MPQDRDLKRLVRARMAATGENYTQALTRIQASPESGAELAPLPPSWRRVGNQADAYDVGLLPADATYGTSRVVRLRSRADDDVRPTVRWGFGALMQSIAAGRYLDRRVRFSAQARTLGVDGWAGLWLRVDGPAGMLKIDNMKDRALHGTCDWQLVDIVLDVDADATSLHFGVLLDGSGAVDIAEPRLDVVDATVPTTVTPRPEQPLPDEPVDLDFGVGAGEAAR